MPAINGIYNKHPQTQEEGIWIDLCTNNLKIKGFSDLDINLLKTGLNKEQMEQKIRDEFQRIVTDVVNIKIKLKNIIPYEIEEFIVEEGTSKSYSV